MKFGRNSANARLVFTDNWMNTNEEVDKWKRACGCIKTSDKLKQILMSFPTPPPPTNINSAVVPADGAPYLRPPEHPVTCISANCKYPSAFPVTVYHQTPISTEKAPMTKPQGRDTSNTVRTSSKPFRVVSEIVSLVQLSVTATALALYYLLYCYMQLVYYTLRSALYFHNADGPMKITIGVVACTSLLIGFNVVLRMERMAGFLS